MQQHCVYFSRAIFGSGICVCLGYGNTHCSAGEGDVYRCVKDPSRVLSSYPESALFYCSSLAMMLCFVLEAIVWSGVQQCFCSQWQLLYDQVRVRVHVLADQKRTATRNHVSSSGLLHP